MKISNRNAIHNSYDKQNIYLRAYNCEQGVDTLISFCELFNFK